MSSYFELRHCYRKYAICVFFVKRDKRMRAAGRCAERYPAAEHPHA
jgi:hypothetical protein